MKATNTGLAVALLTAICTFATPAEAQTFDITASDCWSSMSSARNAGTLESAKTDCEDTCNSSLPGAAAQTACRGRVGRFASRKAGELGAGGGTPAASTGGGTATTPTGGGTAGGGGGPRKVRCLNGSFLIKAECPVTDCPSGYVGRGRTLGDCAREEVETEPEMKVCPGGRQVPIADTCPCEDGSMPAAGKACLSKEDVAKLSCGQRNAYVVMNGNCRCKSGFEWNNADPIKATACVCSGDYEEWRGQCRRPCEDGYARHWQSGKCELASVVKAEDCLRVNQDLAYGVTTPAVKGANGKVTTAEQRGWICQDRPAPPTFAGLLWANVRHWWWAWILALAALGFCVYWFFLRRLDGLEEYARTDGRSIARLGDRVTTLEETPPPAAPAAEDEQDYPAPPRLRAPTPAPAPRRAPAPQPPLIEMIRDPSEEPPPPRAAAPAASRELGPPPVRVSAAAPLGRSAAVARPGGLGTPARPLARPARPAVAERHEMPPVRLPEPAPELDDDLPPPPRR